MYIYIYIYTYVYMYIFILGVVAVVVVVGIVCMTRMCVKGPQDTPVSARAACLSREL